MDVVLDGSGIPEKLLGVTLFALVPNTTEVSFSLLIRTRKSLNCLIFVRKQFLNAIAFALNGNVALR